MKSHTLRLVIACLWCWATFIPLRVDAIPLWIFAGAGGSEPSDLPAASTVLAWYTMESNGNDATANGRNLSATGTPAHSTGKVGNCFANSAASNWYSQADQDWQHELGGGDFSLAMWVRTTDATPTSLDALFSKYNNTGSQRSWRLALNTGGTISFVVSGDGTTLPTATSTGTLSDNTWAFLVAVFDASTQIDVYINATPDGTQSTSIPASILNSTQNMAVGTHSSSSANTFVGDMDEVAIFSVALTQAQITALYNGGTGVTYTDLP